MSEFYSILTTKGLEKLAALVVGEELTLTHMAFGNSTNLPYEGQTELGSEKHRCELTKVLRDNNNPNTITIETIIKGEVGGFWIREIGVFDSDGDLFAVGKYPATYKPDTTEGSVKELGVRMLLRVSNTDGTIITYSNGIIEGANTNLDNLTFAGQKKFDDKADLESPVFTGTPKVPTAEVGTDTEQIANTAFVQEAIAKLIGASPELLDTLEELAAALGNDPNFATTILDLIAEKADEELLEAIWTAINGLTDSKADKSALTAITNALADKANKNNDTIVVASANPTTGFSVRNIRAQTADPGAGSALTTGNILLVYED